MQTEVPVTLQAVSAYRTIYLLCDISAKTNLLKATHSAAVLSGGSTPTWGVFRNDTGELIRVFGSREQIARAFPKKAWRVKRAKWTLAGVTEPVDTITRQEELMKQIKPSKVKHEALPDNVTRLPTAKKA